MIFFSIFLFHFSRDEESRHHVTTRRESHSPSRRRDRDSDRSDSPCIRHHVAPDGSLSLSRRHQSQDGHRERRHPSLVDVSLDDDEDNEDNEDNSNNDNRRQLDLMSLCPILSVGTLKQRKQKTAIHGKRGFCFFSIPPHGFFRPPCMRNRIWRAVKKSLWFSVRIGERGND